MFTKIIETSFYDTDALGHINNTRLPVFYELARLDLFRIMCEDIADPKQWNLIMARIEVDFIRELFFPHTVTVTTEIEKIGNTSFTVYQQVLQHNIVCSCSRCVMVHFDFAQKKSILIPEHLRIELSKHLIKGGEDAQNI